MEYEREKSSPRRKKSHCQRMKPVVKEFKRLMQGTLQVVEVDIDQENTLADLYTIEVTPTFILLRRGEQLWR